MTALFIYNTAGQLVCKHSQHKSVIKSQKLRILMWNWSLITSTGNSQGALRKLNKSSLPISSFLFFKATIYLLKMLRVGDNNHMLHEHDINHPGLLSIHPMLSVYDVPAYLWTLHLLNISAQVSLPMNSLNTCPIIFCHILPALLYALSTFIRSAIVKAEWTLLIFYAVFSICGTEKQYCS